MTGAMAVQEMSYALISILTMMLISPFHHFVPMKKLKGKYSLNISLELHNFN